MTNDLGRVGEPTGLGDAKASEPSGLGATPAIPRACHRCAVLEDLLETARIQVEHARREAEKADDEALIHKAESLRLRSAGSRQDYALIKEFQRRAERAEAALAAAARQGGDVKQAPAESPQSGGATHRNAQPSSDSSS